MNEEEMKTPYVKGERQKALKSEQKRQEKYGDNQHWISAAEQNHH